MGSNIFKSACLTLQGIESMNMIRKGQANTNNVSDEIKLINQIFSVA